MQTLKTDWTQYDVMKPDDLNAICAAVNERGERIEQLQRENRNLRKELENKVNSGIPPVYKLEVYSGADSHAMYTRTDFGLVTVWGQINFPAPPSTDQLTAFAALPEAFWPAEPILAIPATILRRGVFEACYMNLTPTGVISLRTNVNSANDGFGLYLNFSFSTGALAQ